VYTFLDSIAEYEDWAGIRAAPVSVDEIVNSTKLGKNSFRSAMRKLSIMGWAKHTHGYFTINTYAVAELDIAIKRGLKMIGMEDESGE
jgi:hypothetical protein